MSRPMPNLPLHFLHMGDNRYVHHTYVYEEWDHGVTSSCMLSRTLSALLGFQRPSSLPMMGQIQNLNTEG